MVIPQVWTPEGSYDEGYLSERLAYEDSMNAKVALNDGETIVSVLTQDFDGDLQDEQIIAYRNLLQSESPIYITYVDYDNRTRGYKRVWDTPTIITRPGTIAMYAQDMLGDRSVCVIVTGMNGSGEHTLTVLRKNTETASGDSSERSASGNLTNGLSGEDPRENPFTKIAELKIDGSITIEEKERTQAYQLGLTKGQSFNIAAFGRDNESSNIMDQLELSYVYNPALDRYEQGKVSRVPGTQIEQRQVNEILNGKPGVFENFINGLWYYVSPGGTVDHRQYIYFDPQNRELIFFVDETQQVFTWLNSSATRYGLYVSSQNISVTTLRRALNIELETLDSIRIRVSEDVHLKIGVTDSWDGSYRKAGPGSMAAQGAPGRSARLLPAANPASTTDPPALPRAPHVSAAYDGSIGKLVFARDGNYELYTQGVIKKGKYAFFVLDNLELLELRPGNITGLARETYLVTRHIPEPAEGQENGDDSKVTPANTGSLREELTLVRVRLSTRGIQEVHEAAIFLSPADGA
jgi:hypothetical protein